MQWTCKHCGRSCNISETATVVRCACGKESPPGKPGLGDMLAAGLEAVGITKERYQIAKEKLGLQRSCNCGRRQKKLNELGKKIGIN